MLKTDTPHDEKKPPVNTPRISMREIDLDHLGDADENPEAVRFYVRLSEAPSEGWIEEFSISYRQTPYTLKPPVEIEGDRMAIVFLPRYSNELQGFFQFLGLIMRRANDELHRTEEMHVSNAQERRKSQFREVLRKIHVPQER